MTLTLTDKKAIVAEVSEVAASAQSAVLAEYRGLSVDDMTQLRANARQSNVYLRVVRNTLAKRAVAETDFQCLTEAFTGPVIVAFAKDEPGSAARLMRNFAKDHDSLVVTALSMGGKLLDAKQLSAVADLPTKDEAIATLMAVMKAPISKFVRTLAEPHGKLVRTIAAVRDQKQENA